MINSFERRRGKKNILEIFSTLYEYFCYFFLSVYKITSVLVKNDCSSVSVIIDEWRGGEMTKKDCPRNYQSIT